MRKTNGFTLLELIVVVTIILLLVGLLFPAFNRVRDMGHRARSVNNLKQLYQASMNFANAHGDRRFPFAATEEVWEERPLDSGRMVLVGTNSGWVAWAADNVSYWWDQPGTHERGLQSVRNGTLFSHLGGAGDESVYVCPSMIRLVRREGARTGGGAGGLNYNVVLRRSYGMNARMSNRRYYNIDNPSRTLLFAEQGFILQTGFTYSLQDIRTGSSHWNDPEPLPNRRIRRFARNLDGAIDHAEDAAHEHIGEYHKGTGNAVFVDGHVERLPYTQTRQLINPDW